MALLTPFDRPLTLRPLAASCRGRTGSPYVPPPFDPHEDRLDLSNDPARTLEVSRFLVHALLVDPRSFRELRLQFEARVDERVEMWSPCVSTSSRVELVAVLLAGDDAISDVSVSIDREAMAADSTVFVSWRVAGRFSNAAFLNDDVLIEPSNARVETSGVLVLTFTQGRASRIHCFYDVLGLLEQMVLTRDLDQPEPDRR